MPILTSIAFLFVLDAEVDLPALAVASAPPAAFRGAPEPERARSLLGVMLARILAAETGRDLDPIEGEFEALSVSFVELLARPQPPGCAHRWVRFCHNRRQWSKLASCSN